MDKLPVISGKDLLWLLQKMGFGGAHPRGRLTLAPRTACAPTVGNADLPKGLLRKIIREDLKLTVEVFTQELERL
ncbi:MAG: hypothetical protein IPI07_00615 [Flavobacteriales bacterium]|nr:hypothetical protein [Flavobacteriales bacterium]